MTKKIVTHLMNIAKTSFDMNHRWGRRGKEWALESEITYQAAKRIEELEKALEPFVKYYDCSSVTRNGHKDTLVVGVMGINRNTGEYDGIELQNRHFKKASTIFRKR